MVVCTLNKLFSFSSIPEVSPEKVFELCWCMSWIPLNLGGIRTFKKLDFYGFDFTIDHGKDTIYVSHADSYIK